MPSNMTIADLIVAAAIFGLLVTVIFSLLLAFRVRRAKRTRTLEERLGLAEERKGDERTLRLWNEGQEATTTVPGSVLKASVAERLEQMRRDAGWDAPGPTIVLGVLGLVGIVSTGVLFATQSLVLAAIGGATTLVVFWIYVRRRVEQRVAVFERQLIDALELAARSLRAGHPLSGAFQLISEDLDDPVRTVFAEICQHQQMGVSMGSALKRACAKTKSSDLELFATSVTIQLRSGGNLAEMMDRVAAVIRERVRLSRRVRVLTAQTQFSKRILLALPFLLFVVLNAMRPQYMAVLYDTTTGQLLLGTAAGGLLLGAYVMNRLAVIRY